MLSQLTLLVWSSLLRVQVSKLTLCVKNLQWHHSQSPQGSGKELPRAVPFAQNWDLHLQIRCFSNMNSLLFKITVSCCSSQNWSGGAPGSRVHSISWLFGRTTPGGAPSLSSIFISSPIFTFTFLNIYLLSDFFDLRFLCLDDCRHLCFGFWVFFPSVFVATFIHN